MNIKREPIDITVSINFPDPQNVWISTLIIFTITWDKNLFVGSENYFANGNKKVLNIQFIWFKKTFKNLHLKKPHMRGSTVGEIDTIFVKNISLVVLEKEKVCSIPSCMPKITLKLKNIDI